MEEKLSILLLENTKYKSKEVINQILSFGYTVEVEHIFIKGEIEEALDKGSFDIGILIYPFQQINIEYIQTLLEDKKKNIPFIVVFLEETEENAERYMRKYTWDYVTRNTLLHIGNKIKMQISHWRIYKKYFSMEEEFLKESNRLDITLSSIGDGVITTDTNGKILSLNKAAEKLTGWTQVEAKEKASEEILNIKNKKTEEKLENPFKNALEAGITVGLKKNTVLVTKNKEERFISASCSPLKDQSKKIIGAIGVFRDITRIIKATEKIENDKNNLEAIFDASPIGVLIVDKNMIVKDTNQFLTQIIQSTKDKIMNQPIGIALSCERVYKNGKVCNMYSKCKKCKFHDIVHKVFYLKNSVHNIEIQQTFYIKEKKTTLWLSISAVPIVISEDIYVLVLIEDVTEYRKVTQELIKSKKIAEANSKAKSEFLANMSHEIRTPLNGMLGMIDLTLMSDLNNKQKDNLLTAKSCANSLLTVINDILDFSKIEANKMVIDYIQFDIRELMERILRVHACKAHEKGLELNYNISKDIPMKIIGDPNRLQQILNNLIGNAIKFTDFGKVDISIENQQKDRDKGILKFFISDTGIGIEKEQMYRLFKSFSQVDSSITRKYGGTGLGLAISKRLVEMMEGSIGLDSQLGKGSTFYFSIGYQFKNESVENHKPKIQETENKVNKKIAKILLVEDNKINQKVTRLILEEEGYEIKIADHGKEALELLKTNDFDLILMDIEMPILDGVETTKEIRKIEEKTKRHIPIIAFTSYAIEGDKKKFLKSGMDDYISKPIDYNKLFFKIQQWTDKTKEKIESKINNNMELPLMDNNHLKEKEDIVKEIKEKVKNMILLWESNEIIKIEKCSHQIKLLASNLNEVKIKNMAFKIELALRREDFNDAKNWINGLAEETQKL